MDGRFAPAPALPSSELPVVPREYHDFYRTPRYRRWHSVVALVVFVVAWGSAVLAVTIAAVVYEMLLGGATPEEMAHGLLTPALFLANNLGVALAIPAALVTHRGIFGQRAGWLFSIQGRLRWSLVRRYLLVAAAVHLAVLASWLVANGVPEGLRVSPQTPFLLAVVLLTTPLQAAGEEVAFRGLATRAIGSWFNAPRVGLVVATVTTAALFVLVHGAGDLRLNAFYLSLAVAASALTWRTGGQPSRSTSWSTSPRWSSCRSSASRASSTVAPGPVAKRHWHSWAPSCSRPPHSGGRPDGWDSPSA